MTTWKRKDVKTKAKKSFKDNFWKCVATALILVIVGGGSAGAFGGGFGSSSGSYRFNNRGDDSHRIEVTYDDNIVVAPNGIIGTEGLSEEDREEIAQEFERAQEELEDVEIPTVALAAFGVILTVVLIFAVAVGLALDAFVANPLELGCKRFFRRNLDEPASMSNIAFAFDSNYKNICKTMFLRDIYTFLWCLLFVIPGVIKAYEYKMIPYLLSEDPSMSTEQAFEESKKLMTGNKWKAFVLDLSFILWDLASFFTCGIAGVFWVTPYKASTQAALYEAIRYGTDTTATVQA